jgi:hypothetical protein
MVIQRGLAPNIGLASHFCHPLIAIHLLKIVLMGIACFAALTKRTVGITARNLEQMIDGYPERLRARNNIVGSTRNTELQSSSFVAVPLLSMQNSAKQHCLLERNQYPTSGKLLAPAAPGSVPYMVCAAKPVCRITACLCCPTSICLAEHVQPLASVRHCSPDRMLET